MSRWHSRTEIIPREQAAIVGANIRALRQRKGWPQSRVGELMGWISNSTVCAAEGHRDGRQCGYTTDEVRRLASIFGVEPWQITTRCANCKGRPPAGFACLTCGVQSIGLSSGIGHYADRMRFDPRTYPLDLDIGEVADGYHLIVRGISLTGDMLIVDWAFAPELAEDARLWPNMSYDADVSPRGWNSGVSDFGGFERPVQRARYAYIDFFRPAFDWMSHFDRHGQPDGDYPCNRLARPGRWSFSLNEIEVFPATFR